MQTQQATINGHFPAYIGHSSYSAFNAPDTETSVYEYLLVAHADVATNELLVAEKQSFYERYDEKISVNTKPHITVANFLANEAMEETIGRWMQRICSQQKSFQVTLNNYSGFPPHSIYVRVQYPQPFQQLAKQLKVIDTYVKGYGLPAAKIVSNPHLTIARRLPANVYTKAMFDYAQREFHGSFVVNELVLLRRKGQFDACKKINVFSLNPEMDDQQYGSPVIQPELF